MLVIVTENVPPRLRGFLSRLMLEIRAGVYVGDFSVKVREEVWEAVCREVDSGNAVIAWSTNNESGYSFDTCGQNRRIPITIDGFPLISFLPENELQTSEN